MSRADRRAAHSIVAPFFQSGELQSCAVVLFDEFPARELAEKRLRDCLKKLHAAQRSLLRFEEGDVPEFERWRATEFGNSLTELRDMQSELHMLSSLVDEVEAMRFFTGRSYRACYEQVMYDREHPDERLPEEDESWSAGSDSQYHEDTDRRRSERGRRGEDEREEELKELFAELFGIDCDLGDPEVARAFADFKRRLGFGDSDEPIGAGVGGAGSASTDAKRIYRSLARKLHPDHRESLDAFTSGRLDDLWHEAQDAYRRLDFEELLRIEAIIDIESEGISKTTQLESIENAAEKHGQSLRAVERSLRLARKNPAWMFSKKPALKKGLKALIERELGDSASRCRHQLAHCRQLIERWSSVRKRGSKARPAKKQSKERASRLDPPQFQNAETPSGESFDQMDFSF